MGSPFSLRLQNSRGFFTKSVKKSVKRGVGLARAKRASRKNFERLSPVSLSVFSLVPDLLFDCSRVLEYAKIRAVLQSNSPYLTRMLSHSVTLFFT